MNLYLQLLLLTVFGWVNRHQQCVIEYLQAKRNLTLEGSEPSGPIGWSVSTSGSAVARAHQPLFVRRFWPDELGSQVSSREKSPGETAILDGRLCWFALSRRYWVPKRGAPQLLLF